MSRDYKKKVFKKAVLIVAEKPELQMSPDMEARFIEQDHRLISVVMNAIDAWKYWDENDPRRRAAFRAVIWRIFSPATAATVGLGITAIASLFVAIYSTNLLEQQNRKLDQQTFLAEASRSAALVSELGAVIGGINDAVSKACTKFDGRKLCWPDVSFRNRANWWAEYSKTVLLDDSFAKNESNKYRKVTDLRFIRFPLPSELQGRIVALSNGLRPYRFLIDEDIKIRKAKEYQVSFTDKFGLNLDNSTVDSPLISSRALSIERGILLDVLTRSDVELGRGIIWAADFRQSMFRDKDLLRKVMSGVRLDGSDLTCTSFNESDLVSTSFKDAVLRFATFKSADLSYSNFADADLEAASFVSATLPTASSFSGVNLKDADFEFAVVPDANWINEIKTLAKGFDSAAWRLETNIDNEKKAIFRIQLSIGRNKVARDGVCQSKATPVEAGNPYDYKP